MREQLSATRRGTKTQNDVRIRQSRLIRMKLRMARSGPQIRVIRSILACYDHVARFVRGEVTVRSGHSMLINVLLFDIDNDVRTSVTVNSYENLVLFLFVYYGNTRARPEKSRDLRRRTFGLTLASAVEKEANSLEQVSPHR